MADQLLGPSSRLGLSKQWRAYHISYLAVLPPRRKCSLFRNTSSSRILDIPGEGFLVHGLNDGDGNSTTNWYLQQSRMLHSMGQDRTCPSRYGIGRCHSES